MTLADFCKKNSIDYHEFEKLNTNASLALAREARADIGLSLNNFQIIKRPLLETAREAFINFHNGPLPRYGGVNVCSWAIINGESEYGVTWHYIDEGIDTGDIIAQKTFPLDDSATALSLTMQCFQSGLGLLEELVPTITVGAIPRRQQPNADRSYYSLKDSPNDGWIDFNWTVDRVDRFLRGLSFHPLPNPFFYPRIRIGASSYNVRIASAVGGNGVESTPPGSILSISEDAMTVACNGGCITLRELLDEELEPVAIARLASDYALVVGGVLQ